MIVRRGFKYRLYPTEEQKKQLIQFGGNTRFLWNLFLKQSLEEYEKTKKFIFARKLRLSIPKLRKQYTFLKDSPCQSLHDVATYLDTAFRDFFKKRKGFPKFKKKNFLKDSFTCSQGWKVSKGSIFIPKVKRVRWKKHRRMKGKPKHITITQDGDKWYCSVLCEYHVKEKNKKANNIIGCDVGLKQYATFLDGIIIDNPRHFKKHKKRLSKLQKKLCKKKINSKNRFKQRIKVRKINNKIRDARKDFLHKTSNLIAKNYDGIIVENLNIKGLVKNKYLGQSIRDASWYEFNRQLKYKCEENSKYFIVLDKFIPTSKKCSNCGNIQKISLDTRIFRCIKCKINIDRDLNAAINIKNLGLTTVGHTECNACGDEGLPSSVKQEKECLENQAEAIY